MWGLEARSIVAGALLVRLPDAVAQRRRNRGLSPVHQSALPVLSGIARPARETRRVQPAAGEAGSRHRRSRRLRVFFACFGGVELVRHAFRHVRAAETIRRRRHAAAKRSFTRRNARNALAGAAEP